MNSKKIAIVLAGGKGSRMKTDRAKQYIEVCGKPLICYSLEVFEKSSVDEIILVVPSDDVEYSRHEIVEKYGYTKVTQIVSGGSERYDSVFNGLLAAKDCEYVFIHDGARPCVTSKIIQDGLYAVEKNKAVVAAVQVKDTIKIVSLDGAIESTPDRNHLYQIQTPQIFDFGSIMSAYTKMMKDSDKSAITDDGMVMEKYGDVLVRIYKGDYCNIKVTTPEDIALAEAFIVRNSKL